MVKDAVGTYRVATQLQAMRQRLAVPADEAGAVRAQGRARFYDAFWGIGAAATDNGDAFARVKDLAGVEERYDLTNMTVQEVVALARDITGGGYLSAAQGDLLGLSFNRLPYAWSAPFQASPLVILAGGMSGRAGMQQSYNWLNIYRDQTGFLQDTDAPGAAIDDSQRVLAELERLQAEQSMYWAIDLARTGPGSRRQNGGFGGYGGAALMTPASYWSLWSADIGS